MTSKPTGIQSSARPKASAASELRPAALQNGAKPAIRPFSNSLPMQLLRVREAVMHRFRPHLHAHGITEQQWRILRALAETESLEIHELGSRCCIHPASLSHMLPKLETAELITRKSNAADQRRIIVSLAPAGRRLFVRMGAESEKIYAEITRQLGSKRIETLYQLLGEALDTLSGGSKKAEKTNGPVKTRMKGRKTR
jgi:homoprotocatechuate degradation regulator HpaR